MRVTTVFNKLLALQGAFVQRVEFTADGIVVGVRKRALLHGCPYCSFCCRARYDCREREWRHLSLGKWRVIIRATLCRLECPEHKVVTEAIPWAEHDSRFTRDFEDLVAWVAREMNKTAVKNLLHIAWATVGNIIERVVARKLDRARLERLYRIGIDEVSYRKGHKYLTVVADHETGDPVWIGEGRSQATVGAFFDELGERALELEAVSMDMCAPYILETKARAPQAEIAFDPFHVVKLASEAVHDVRRTEACERKGTAEAAVLKGSRWALLKAPESDALAALQAAEVDRWLRYPDPFPHQRRSASVDGFSLHAGVRIHENDRRGLGRICRYLLRPPLALARLSRGEYGRAACRRSPASSSCAEQPRAARPVNARAATGRGVLRHHLDPSAIISDSGTASLGFRVLMKLADGLHPDFALVPRTKTPL